MLISDWIKVKWRKNNKEYYESKGYYFTKYSDEFLVKVDDLNKFSNANVLVICNYCFEEGIEKIIEKNYSTYKIQNEKSNIHKDCCSKCRYKKIKESNLLKHGVENVSNIPEVRRKAEETCLNKFGFKSYLQSEEGKQKIINTCLDRYGVSNYAKTEEYREKTILTCQEKYNSNSPAESVLIRNKIKENNLNKYGYEYPIQNKEIRELLYKGMINKFGVKYYSQTEWYNEKYKNTCLLRFYVGHPFKDENVRNMAKIKSVQTLYKNGTCKTSSQQLYIYNLLKDNGYNVDLNYPLSRINMDVALFISVFKIDIEYDAWYWHQDQQKDRRRDGFTISQNWKVLRIKNCVLLPTLEQLKEAIDKLIYSNRTFTSITLDDWTKKYNKDMGKTIQFKQIN